MRFVLVLGLACLLGCAASQADSPRSKEVLIQELLSITKADQMGLQVIDQMLQGADQAYPDVPAEFWSEFRNRVDPDALVAIVVPIYDRHFSEGELRASIAFYRSEAGQSILEKMPAVMQESFVAGQAWGQRVAEGLVEELRQKGHEPREL